MTIFGRLTNDAQVRTTATNKQVVSFAVALNDTYKNKQGERIEQTTFFDCAYWITPNVAQFLTQGTLVELIGRVSARAWTGKDGEPKAGLNFTASRIILHGGGKRPTVNAVQDNAKPNRTAAGEANYSEGDDDLPF